MIDLLKVEKNENLNLREQQIKIDAVKQDLERKLLIQLNESETLFQEKQHLELIYKKAKKEALFTQGRFDEMRGKFEKLIEDFKGLDQNFKEARETFEKKDLNYRQRLII